MDVPEQTRAEKGHFAKGTPGNPNGRPRAGTSIAELFRSYLEGEDKERRVPRVVALAAELYRMAMEEHNTAAGRALLEWGVPRPAQRIDLRNDSLSAWAEAFDKL